MTDTRYDQINWKKDEVIKRKTMGARLIGRTDPDDIVKNVTNYEHIETEEYIEF